MHIMIITKVQPSYGIFDIFPITYVWYAYVILPYVDLII